MQESEPISYISCSSCQTIATFCPVSREQIFVFTACGRVPYFAWLHQQKAGGRRRPGCPRSAGHGCVALHTLPSFKPEWENRRSGVTQGEWLANGQHALLASLDPSAVFYTPWHSHSPECTFTIKQHRQNMSQYNGRRSLVFCLCWEVSLENKVKAFLRKRTLQLIYSASLRHLMCIMWCWAIIEQDYLFSIKHHTDSLS